MWCDPLDALGRLFSNELLPAIGLTMIVETAIEGGATLTWVGYTVVVSTLYVLANHLHEGTEDMVEDLHEEIYDANGTHDE
jgi:hypothetical protein